LIFGIEEPTELGVLHIGVYIDKNRLQMVGDVDPE